MAVQARVDAGKSQKEIEVEGKIMAEAENAERESGDVNKAPLTQEETVPSFAENANHVVQEAQEAA